MATHRIETDVLVVGGGIAAVFAACKAREYGVDVMLVDKAHLGRSGCTALASGVNHFFQPGDDEDVWIRGESNPQTNHRLFKENLMRTYEVQKFLERAGVKFVMDGGKVLRVGGARLAVPHSSMMAEGGPQMGLALRAETLRQGVRVINRVMITGLLTSDGKLPTQGRVVGAVGFHARTGESYVFRAKAVIMCTGPYGIPYHRAETTYVTRSMPIDASGEGIHAMWEAGAVLGKMEIGIKSPSPIEFDCAPALEMLTALGGHTIWVNRLGHRFLTEEFRKKDFGRSAVASAILKEYLEGRGPVGINVSHLRPDERRLLKQVVPIVVGNFESAGYDLARDTVPYSVGVPAGKGVSGAGARINERGETSIAALYAAGNCSDGAYICLGQTLYVCGLTGWWAGESAAKWVRTEMKMPEVSADQVALYEQRYSEPRSVKDPLAFEEVRDQVAEIQLGLTPTLNAQNLGAALDRLDSVIEEKLPKLGASDSRRLARVNALKVSLPIMRLVLQIMEHRKESRGNLIRDDHPFTDNDEWLVHTVIQRATERESRLWDIPVPEDWWILRPPKGKFLHPYFQEAGK